MRTRTDEEIGRAATSVLDRIKSTAKARGEDAQLLIVRYALQRFLHRLSIGPHADLVVIKGGMMMPLLGAGSRPTEDIDGHSNVELDADGVAAVLGAVCATPPDEEDGVVFDASSLRVVEIRDGDMPGFRAFLSAEIRPNGGKPTRLPIKVDLCFGDVITPDPVHAELPSAVRGFAPVRVAVYPWPTVVAEKLHALARHGFATTRVKDLYDIALISRSVDIDGGELASAIASTFSQWGNTSPAIPLRILVPEFADAKRRAWADFLRKKGANAEEMSDIRVVVSEIEAFARPALEAAVDGKDLEGFWLHGEGWRTTIGPRPSGPGSGMKAR